MTAPPRTGRRLRLAVALLAVAAASPSPAADKAKKPAKAVDPDNVWSDDDFENWVFRQGMGPVSGGTDQVRKRFDAMLGVKVEEIDRVCRLSDGQKRTLRLLGAGDVKRVFEQYARAKREFNRLGNDTEKLQEVMPLLGPAQEAARSGPFGPDSLLRKSLRRVLTAEQFAKYDAADRERLAFRHKAQLESAILTLEQTAPLRAAQRQALLALLLAEVKPARLPANYGSWWIVARVAQLPEAKLKPIFSDAQWKALGPMLDQYKGLAGRLDRAGGGTRTTRTPRRPGRGGDFVGWAGSSRPARQDLTAGGADL